MVDTSGIAIISTSAALQTGWSEATGTARSPSGPCRPASTSITAPGEIGFTWAGFDEVDEVSDTGCAELQPDGSLQIEFEYHLDDEAILKAPSGTFFKSLLKLP